MIIYNASLTNINKHCLYTEKFNTINYRCLNYYNFLDEPIQKLKQETNEFLQNLNDKFNYVNQNKQKRSTAPLLKSIQSMILPIMNSVQLNKIINVKKYFGIFKNISLMNIRDWFRNMGIVSSLSTNVNYVSLKLYSQMTDEFSIDPFNYQLYHYYQNIQKLQKSIYAKMEIILEKLNYPNSKKFNLPENYVFNRYVQNEKIRSIFLFQNYTLSFEKTILLIPKNYFHNIQKWQIGRLTNNITDSKCIVQALQEKVTNECQKPEFIKELQDNIFLVRINRIKFKQLILTVNKPGVLQISCKQYNRLFSIAQLYIFSLDQSCTVFYNNIRLIRADSVENFVSPELLYRGKFIPKTETYSNITISQFVNKTSFKNILWNVTDQTVMSRLSENYLNGLDINTTDLTQYSLLGFIILGYISKWIYEKYQIFAKSQNKNGNKEATICGLEETMPLKSFTTMERKTLK